MSILGQDGAAPPPACNRNAIRPEDRLRYNTLLNQVRRAMRERRELHDGYAFGLDGKSISLPETAEWIAFERLCCPFLTFKLQADGRSEDWRLTLEGPPGIKAILAAAFEKR